MIPSIEIDEDSLQDLINIKTGLFYPLKGFMNADEFHSVIDSFTLPDGSVWTIPITLEIKSEDLIHLSKYSVLKLSYKSESIAEVKIIDFFKISKNHIFKLFGTQDENHPGVKKELSKSELRLGCDIISISDTLLKNTLSPLETKQSFKEKNWKTIVGFQTRNPVHKAHEYLQRLGMEICDGLFINPLVGWKKKGDFSELSIQKAYQIMIDHYYPKNKVFYKELRTQMRYAGPKEALFHAIIRKNLGCTHFIIGRDHAGVGSYYGIYEAHQFAEKIISKHKLGIHLLLTKEPYFCEKCEAIVTENHCNHYHTNRVEISGTLIRDSLSKNLVPDNRMMRSDVAQEIITLGDDMFVK